jgi:general secretion pathway protein J
MKGFTLVEMLVALFIFSLIAAASVGIMRFTVDNRETVRAHAGRLAEFQRMRAILKADLSQAAERRTRDANGRPIREAFYGGTGGTGVPILRLARRGWENPDAEPRASVQYVEYRLVDGRLERVARRALDGGAFGPPQILVDRVRQAAIHFLWHGQWIENLPGGPVDPLPQAVRFDIALDEIGAVSQLFLVTGEAR